MCKSVLPGLKFAEPPTEIRTVSDVYLIDEVARAADVPVELVRQLADFEQIPVVDNVVTEPDAVRLLQGLRSTPGGRAPLTPLPEARRRGGLPLVASGGLHLAFIILVLAASSFGLLKASQIEDPTPEKAPVRMVFMMSPGPGGGGGGGGLKVPAPPPRAERKAPAPKTTSNPVPPRRPYRPPPRPIPQPVPTPPPLPVPLPVQAPVVPDAGDAQEVQGVMGAPPQPVPPSPGPGTGGGIGTGRGTGLGEGDDAGIGEGSGGGTGGGPFRPGTGIEPPQLLREVRPLYTDDARRRAIEGEVVMEIVVRRDGTVGNVRVLRTLGSGLEQRAIAAVRQWRFAPATRRGSAVDVLVEVAVGFTLR
jgi:periplasmic protein TonB